MDKYLKDRIRTDVTLSDDKNVAIVSYRFRGLDEAYAFQRWVNAMIASSSEFYQKSDEMDRLCKENHCEEF